MSSCHHIIISSYHHGVISSYHHTIMSSYHHIIISSYRHIIISSYHHIIVSSYHHIVIPSHHQIIISSYHHTIISSYHHIIISSYHHTIISSYHHIITWQDEKSICHFLVNSADRPGIWSNCNQSRLNPGTIGRIRQKMAREFSKLQTAQKSRGWLRFRRFFDEIDRVAPNFFFENFTPSEKILLNRSGPRSARDRSETEDRTGPDRISVPIRRTGRR